MLDSNGLYYSSVQKEYDALIQLYSSSVNFREQIWGIVKQELPERIIGRFKSMFSGSLAVGPYS